MKKERRQEKGARRRQASGAQSGSDAANASPLSHAHYDTSARQSQRPRHGRIIENGQVWAKRVRGSVHMRRRPFAGWAADVADVLAAHTLGVQWLRLDDAESGKRYWAAINDLAYKGQLFDYGAGDQLCLPLGEWHVGPTPPEPVGVQLALFAGVTP